MSGRCAAIPDKDIWERVRPLAAQAYGMDLEGIDTSSPGLAGDNFIWEQISLRSGHWTMGVPPLNGWIDKPPRLLMEGMVSALLNKLDHPADSVKDEWKTP